MFGSLLERPLVAAHAVDRLPLLVIMFEKELDDCKVIYNKYFHLIEELGEVQEIDRFSEKKFY